MPFGEPVQGKMTHELASTTKAWTTLRGREVVSLGRELLGGNGVVSDFLVRPSASLPPTRASDIMHGCFCMRSSAASTANKTWVLSLWFLSRKVQIGGVFLWKRSERNLPKSQQCRYLW